jgi:hypothetical protein
MKKIAQNICLAAALLCGFGGCVGLLDTAPYNAVASEGMWKSEALVDQGVAGVYSALQDWAPYSGSFASKNGSSWAFEPWGMNGQLRYGEALTNGSINPGNGVFSNTWRRLYEGVLRSNDAIKNIPELSPAAPEKNARLVAEVKFLRAYFYLRLNALYGRDGLGVPLYTEPTTIKECINGQASEDEVYAQIIKDLTDCINEPNLPNKDGSGRVSKGAAYALRGKAYLHQGAKFAANGSVAANQELLTKAAADFDKVAGCGFALFQGGYKELFLTANETCDEMFFSIQHIAEPGYGTLSQKLCGSRFAFGVSGGNGWGDLTVSPYIVDLYENADGTDFNWEAVDPSFSGWNSMAPTDRAVFFLRDIEDAEGNTIKQSGDGQPLAAAVITRVNAILDAASPAAKAKYLPHGNEARILKAYANRDPRLAANVITPYSGIIGGYSYSGAGNAMEVFYRWPVQGTNQLPATTKRNDLATDDATNFTYFHRKFVYEGANLAYRDDGPTDEPLIRYADVLLMWAEALIELNDFAGAAAKINQVRSRVGMPAITITSQADGRTKVRNERRREFVNEGINFFDEMRWRTRKETKFQGGSNGKALTIWGSTTGAGAYVWPGDFMYVWPVPREETEKNANITRTPGWAY